MMILDEACFEVTQIENFVSDENCLQDFVQLFVQKVLHLIGSWQCWCSANMLMVMFSVLLTRKTSVIIRSETAFGMSGSFFTVWFKIVKPMPHTPLCTAEHFVQGPIYPPITRWGSAVLYGISWRSGLGIPDPTNGHTHSPWMRAIPTPLHLHLIVKVGITCNSDTIIFLL